MSAAAVATNQSLLESALGDVHATLIELLVAADEQRTAVVARDRDRIETVTRRQEQLSARLARAEARRLQLLAGATLSDAIAALPDEVGPRVEDLRRTIACEVRELKRRQSGTQRLLEQTIELGIQTLNFLQRVVAAPSPAYSAQGLGVPRQSVLVDSRA